MDLRKFLEDGNVAQVGCREPVCIGPAATIAQAIGVMQEHQVGCVLIVEGDRTAGIFTERDVLRRVLHAGLPLDAPVSTAMTPDPIVAEAHEPVYRLLQRMHAGGHRHIPVVDHAGKALGTISVKRVAGFIADHFADIIYNLPPEPNRYGATSEGA